jgi:HK97 family phage portal protein
MQQDYLTYASEGYGLNPVVRACADKIAMAVSSVDITAYKADKTGKLIKQQNHPFIQLLNKPNIAQGSKSFISDLVRYYLISGNAYIHGTGIDSTSKKLPKELYLLKPDTVKVIKGDSVLPKAYEYRSGNGMVTYNVNPITGMSAIKHIKSYNPTDQWTGLSPMTACALGVDNLNEGSRYNLRLLQNGARPSGAMRVNNGSGQSNTLSAEQFNRIKEQIDQQFGGSSNAGRPMLLEGGLEWQEMSMTNKDMDFENSMNKSARDIALVYGVPPMLLGIQGDATYSNMAEARLALWTDTVLPLLQLMLEELNHWFGSMTDDKVTLWYDEEMIPALEPLRKMKADRIEASTTMTINEKRYAMGDEEIAGGDTLLVDSGKIPLELVGDMGLSEPTGI